MRVKLPYTYDIPDKKEQSYAKIKVFLFIPASFLLLCMLLCSVVYLLPSISPIIPALLAGFLFYAFFMTVDGLSVIKSLEVSPSRFPGALKIFTSMGAGPLYIYANVLTIGWPILIAFAVNTMVSANTTYGIAPIPPQTGEWNAKYQVLYKSDVDECWDIVFIISDDGKQIVQAQATQYLGKWTPDTKTTVVLDTQTPKQIVNNTFTLNFPAPSWDWDPTETIEFKGTFLSDKVVNGTVIIRQQTHKWEAYPSEK
jgi:hypothetical protein